MSTTPSEMMFDDARQRAGHHQHQHHHNHHHHHSGYVVSSPFHGHHYQTFEDLNHGSLRQTFDDNDAAHQGDYQYLFDMGSSSGKSPLNSQFDFPATTMPNQSWLWDSKQSQDKDMLLDNHDWSLLASTQSQDMQSTEGTLSSESLSALLMTSKSSIDCSNQNSSQSHFSPHGNPSELLSSLASTSASATSDSPKSNIRSSSANISLEEANEEQSGMGGGSAVDDEYTWQGKRKIQRRQGVTCDQCRSKHIRCINGSKAADGHQCERCREKNLDCTRSYAPPSRRYPRPSRTGKRIEQARMMHGTLASEGKGRFVTCGSGVMSPQMLFITQSTLTPSLSPVDLQLTNRVMAGSISLRLLTCFFATAHMQMPIVDFHNFSARYNFSKGDTKIMAIMANGGNVLEGVPSAKHSAPGLLSTTLPPASSATKSSQKSTLATPGSSEALIAAMHAWAALYTDMPVAFGGEFLYNQNTVVHSKWDMDDPAHQSVKSLGKPTDYVMSANGKLRRPKRKQGVACDTCRLRRLRCDKLERPEGVGCSRCEDKRIVCTDEYIQSKNKKSKDSKGVEDGDEVDVERAVDGTPALARDLVKQWAKDHAVNDINSNYRFGKGREALAYGKARQPFFQGLLKKAMNLVVKHRLKEEPSVEGIQVLMLLAQFIDLTDRREGDAFAEAAAKHIITLRLESNHEVDERDRKAVEEILPNMQNRRLWCCVWTRDAIVSSLYRQTPIFEAERALGIKGSASARTSGHGGGGGEESKAEQINDPEAVAAATSQMSKPVQRPTSADNSAELNGEMGLSFSILALMQVGALSRFMSKHIDNISSSVERGAPRIPLTSRNHSIPSFTEMRRLTKACQALWKSIDSLLLFFDQCSLKARKNMDNLQPFQPLSWIATIKIAGAMLELATFRSLSEKVEIVKILCKAATPSNGGSIDGSQVEHRLHLHAFKELLEQSKQRTLCSCRKIARLVEFLLTKNVFQTGGILLRQIQPVAHFLAMMPCEETITTTTTDFTMLHGEEQDYQHSKMIAAIPLDPMKQAIDPRVLQSSSHLPSFPTDQIQHTFPSSSTPAYPHLQQQDKKEEEEAAAAEAAAAKDLKKGHIPESIFTGQLQPFDTIRKQKEVNICLEAMLQLGYAWPTMDNEIAAIEELMSRQR